MTPEQRAAITKQINDHVQAGVPHNRELGLQLIDFRHARGEAWMKLPYDERFVGDPSTGVLHGAAITTLMDAACGMAVMIKLGTREPIATVDLRIDYLKPARPPEAVIAHAECFKVTRSIAFARGLAYHEDAPDDPIASVAATFIRKAAE
ncbi:MAG: PaaI family thioesterase [Sandaracinaceae bacterium]|nr:PaaI family thioesterase [Sandaracinaceae bacterium]